jgi:hypothetical protein
VPGPIWRAGHRFSSSISQIEKWRMIEWGIAVAATRSRLGRLGLNGWKAKQQKSFSDELA